VRPPPRPRRVPFEHLAEAATDFTSRAAFFAACVALVVLWVPSYLLLRNVDTWQLIINTATTIVTFLMVALLQNCARRSDRAVHRKLDALADGLADLMEHQLNRDAQDLERDITELKDAVGLERVAGRRARPERALRRGAGGHGSGARDGPTSSEMRSGPEGNARPVNDTTR
jgi:low affinity Fe/Cu permease